MKTITTILAALLFSTLFYGQNIGINLSILSLMTIVVLILTHPTIARQKTTIVYISTYILSAIMVFYNHSVLAIFSNFVAFFTLIGTFSESRSSMYIRWLNGLYSTIAGYFHRKVNSKHNPEQPISKTIIDYLQLAKLIGIPLVIGIVFVLLYKNGNPVFNDVIGEIHFDFINFQWLLFTALCFFLFNNILTPVAINPATEQDLITDNHLYPSEPLLQIKLKKEQQLGIVLLALLNILLVFYSVTDIYDLIINTSVTAPALSSQVHDGINALIASIIIAIIIILYFFRGNLNFYKQNNTLKNLSYLWIILNIGLIILITAKNTNYVAIFGLTYKRIGVFIYLFLTLVGLVTTFFKVRNIKNLWFLFRVNTQVAFVVLIGSSCIDWDYAITNYNLNNVKGIDMGYLIDVIDNNATSLYNYSEQHQVPDHYKKRIRDKYIDFIETVSHRNWQEWTYDNLKISKSFD
ncbi:DUF4153 domain-containing protein [Gelidibacter mesophilus]|uniref:DUF4153 domain-containing protein n=1 Tax=Gelidibacter mesophilus TaxID=169050 RepID=UPI0003FDEBED|nr:DUF4153 domain-containing protein [Gelidibacter mesophilus]